MELTPLNPMAAMQPMTSMNLSPNDKVFQAQNASFLDLFRGLVDNVIETNEQVDRDAIDIMLGNIDDLAQVEANIAKASTAVDLLVTVKNEVLSAYNSIINMQI